MLLSLLEVKERERRKDGRKETELRPGKDISAPFESMTKKEFIKLASKCGYANIDAARKYAEEHPKEAYDTEDFIILHETSMHWSGVQATRGLRYAYGVNGKTTAYSNGICGNSWDRQDWGM